MWFQPSYVDMAFEALKAINEAGLAIPEKLRIHPKDNPSEELVKALDKTIVNDNNFSLFGRSHLRGTGSK